MMRGVFRHIILIFFLVVPIIGFSQKTTIDSLENVLEEAAKDTHMVNILKELCWLYKFTNPTKAIDHGEEALELASELNYKKGIERATGNLGVVYTIKGDLNKSVEYYQRSIEISEEIGNQAGVAITSNNLGIIYWNRGLYPKALDTYINSLDITEELGQEEKSANTMTNIGLLYQAMDKDSLALDYYKKALQRFEKFNEKTGLASALQNIGSIYSGWKLYDTAKTFYFKSLEIAKEIDDMDKQASTMYHLGLIYFNLKDYPLALEYYFHALEIHTELGRRSYIAQDYQCIADVYFELQQYNKATEFGKTCLEISHKNGYINISKDASETLSKTYKEMGMYQVAYAYQSNFISLKDSIFNQEKNKAINSLQANYELEKERDKNKILEQEKALDEAEKRRLRFMIFGGAFGFFLLVVLAIVLYRSNNNKKRANEQLSAQKQQIELQKDEIEQKNKDITASITYAERIQKAILPRMEEMFEAVSEVFILFKPRDIVSGDFYWFSKVNEDKFVVAAVDCTGHGVPGAFMSFIGSDWLDRIVNTMGITEPDKILYELDKGIISVLRQNETQSRDGMDMALCTVDKKEGTIEFAGANNPLVFVQDGEIQIIKGDSLAIGGKNEFKKETSVKVFEKHTIDCSKHTVCYMFSDGYQDQFGGEKGKKFMRKPLYQLMRDMHKEPMEKQKEAFDGIISHWMHNYEQIDDILLIGFKV